MRQETTRRATYDPWAPGGDYNPDWSKMPHTLNDWLAVAGIVGLFVLAAKLGT